MNFNFFFSSRRRHTRSLRDWSSDVCSSDLGARQEMLQMPSKRVSEQPIRHGSSSIVTPRTQNITECSMSRTLTGRSEERRVGKECKRGTKRYVERQNG